MRFTFQIQTIYGQKKSFNLAEMKKNYIRWLRDLKGKQFTKFILEVFVDLLTDTARLSTKKVNIHVGLPFT